jgi:hypothetical protein
MKIAYSYRRFSDSRQEFGSSFTRQNDTAKDWCDANGYALSKQAFDDKAKSGFYGENFKEDGALKRFIELHEQGNLSSDLLIIDSVDRFSRLPVSKSASYFLNVVNAGIKLVFSGSYDKRIISSELIDKEPYVLHSIVGELHRAHRESAERSRKIIAAKALKKSEMQSGAVVCHNNIPKYFTFVPDDPRDKKNKKGTYRHNDTTKHVEEMVEKFLAGKSLYEISTSFNKRNIPTIRRKKEWSPSSVRQILKNRVLIGEYLGNKDYVKPIIDEETFLRVQNRLNENVTNRGRKANLINLFRGLCHCTCGRAINVLSGNYKGVNYRYFRCSNYGKRETCAKAYLRAELIENDFFFNFLCKNPYQLINGDDVAEVKAIRKEIAAKTARQNEAQANIDKIVVFLEKSFVDELAAKLPKLKTERDTLKKEIDDLNAKVATIQDAPKELDKWLIKITRFGEGENGEDVTQIVYDGTVEKIREALKDNEAREKLRVILPSLIGKIVIDSSKRNFAVFNRMGRKVFESDRYTSLNNNSERWRQSLKTWTQRKKKDGRVITCKRSQS